MVEHSPIGKSLRNMRKNNIINLNAIQNYEKKVGK
jgi:hypothetical protein